MLNRTAGAGARAIFIGATAQHTGKTSASLGIVSGLQHMLRERVGFLKPVGQQSVQVTNTRGETVVVDKDVPLFKELLGCQGKYSEMSPVLIGKGYTRRFLNGEISPTSELSRISDCFESLCESSNAVVVEGTGHVAVGSSVGLSNARVAARLGIPMVLVVNGGIGSTLDEFSLNAHFCRSQGATIGGVILNKVRSDKLDDIRSYTGSVLESQFGVPVLGIVPDFQNAAYPAVLDFEKLGIKLLAGHEHRASHRQVETVLTSASNFGALLTANHSAGKKSLYIIHASRQDLTDVLYDHLEALRESGCDPVRMPGVIAVGSSPPSATCVRSVSNGVLAKLEQFGVPILTTHTSLESVTKRLQDYTAKLNVSDRARTLAVAHHYASYIDFDAMLQLMDKGEVVPEGANVLPQDVKFAQL